MYANSTKKKAVIINPAETGPTQKLFQLFWCIVIYRRIGKVAICLTAAGNQSPGQKNKTAHIEMTQVLYQARLWLASPT